MCVFWHQWVKYSRTQYLELLTIVLTNYCAFSFPYSYCDDFIKFDGLLSMGSVSSQAQKILELVQWKLDPILHLQTELWPIPQSFSLSHMEKVIGKDLRCVVCLYYYCITLLHYNYMLLCLPFLTGWDDSSSVIWGSSCVGACILALDCCVAKLLPLIFYYFSLY